LILHLFVEAVALYTPPMAAQARSGLGMQTKLVASQCIPNDPQMAIDVDKDSVSHD